MKPVVAFLIFLGLILSAHRAPAAEKLRIASGGFSAAHSALWVAIAMTGGNKEGITPESLKAVDRSILNEIVKSGFVDALYK